MRYLLLLAALLAGGPAGAAPKKARLLVVAPERFHPALGEFVRHKKALLPTELVSLEKALKTPGCDDPERLKRTLYDAWRDRSAGYALLVGDVDILPVRYMVLDRITPAAFDYAFYPSDLYYSDLAKADGRFDDWNARKDSFHAGYFGEVRGEKNKTDPMNYDAIDYRPDIAVGRWPVSTPEDARAVAAKSIAYERAVLEGTATGLRSAALLAVGGWVDSRAQMDRVASLLPAGWRVEKRYYADDRRRDGTPTPNEAEVAKLLSVGTGLLLHAGHGTDDSWAECLSPRTLEEVTRTAPAPVMVSAGCSTAYFAPLPPYGAYVDVNGREHAGTDKGEVFHEPPPPPAPYQSGKVNPAGLGERLLRRPEGGAVAYIGCNTGSQPCGMTLLDGFARSLGKTSAPRLGPCWADAVAHYYDKERLAALKPTESWYPASIFFQGMKFMLFGDPSLQMPAPARKP